MCKLYFLHQRENIKARRDTNKLSVGQNMAHRPRVWHACYKGIINKSIPHTQVPADFWPTLAILLICKKKGRVISAQYLLWLWVMLKLCCKCNASLKSGKNKQTERKTKQKRELFALSPLLHTRNSTPPFLGVNISESYLNDLLLTVASI